MTAAKTASLQEDFPVAQVGRAPAGRLARALQATSLTVLLVCLAGRCFLQELPYAQPAMRLAAVMEAPRQADLPPPDRNEMARVIFAAVILAAAALWLLAGAASGEVTVRGGHLVIIAAAFAAWSLAAALGASDKRAALTGWLEQVSLIAAGLLAVQVFADRRRFCLLLVVLTGLAGALALKAAWQVAVEVPDRIGDFEAYRGERLGQLGWAEGTPQAQLIESRLKDTAPTGFFGLANVFASLLIVLSAGAAGLAIEKFAAARARGRAGRAARSGEIDLSKLAAIVSALIAVAAVAAMVLARSRGAIAATALAAATGCAVFGLRGRLIRHWRRCIAAGAAVFLLGAGAVVAFGLARDRLPTKTMTFRWHYWTASARIVRESPVLGVGPGNFPSAYLRHRRPAAEEEIKMPHDLLVHAACQYGLPGGALYVGVVVCFLIAAARPRPRDAALPTPNQAGRPCRPAPAILLVLPLAVLVFRLVFEAMGDPAVIFFEAVLPAVAIGLGLVVAAWWGGSAPAAGRFPSAAGRVALAAGLCALVLHNMVTFSLWVPGTALAFWIIAGTCAAQTAGESWSFRLMRWPVALAAVLGVAAAAAGVCGPVLAGGMLTERAINALRDGNAPAAVELAEQGAFVDPLDGRSAARAAKFLAYSPGRSVPPDRLISAYAWAAEAIRRHPARWAYQALAGRLAEELAQLTGPAAFDPKTALSHMAKAVELNPMDMRLRIDYAQMLLHYGRGRECLRQLAAAEYIDAELSVGSVMKLQAGERLRIRRIRDRCRAASGPVR